MEVAGYEDEIAIALAEITEPAEPLTEDVLNQCLILATSLGVISPFQYFTPEQMKVMFPSREPEPVKFEFKCHGSTEDGLNRLIDPPRSRFIPSKKPTPWRRRPR